MGASGGQLLRAGNERLVEMPQASYPAGEMTITTSDHYNLA